MPNRPFLAGFFARCVLACLLTLAVTGIVPVSRAFAQSAECDRLQATIASMPRGGGGSSAARFQRAAAKQRSEIGRTEAYSRSLGCERSRFSIVGGDAAPQCGTIQAQLQRMRGNLAQLDSAASGAGGGDNDAHRRQLMERYNASCGDVAPPPRIAAAPVRPRDRGFFENLFGGDEPPRQQQALNVPQPDFQQIPLDATQRPPHKSYDPERSYSAHGGNVAVCVRSCDGGFFPVSYAAGSEDSEDLAAMCTALCPNTPVSVYSYGGGADIETAMSLDGEPYRSLPTAFRYRTTFDPSCSCKPPHQTWVAALADAERLLTSGGASHDVVVSEQRAAELSRPKDLPKDLSKLSAKPAPTKAAAKIGPAAVTVDQIATITLAPDTQGAKEATSGATVPTASQETAGISAGDGTSAPTVTRDQGQTQDIVLAGGVKRRVRIVGPKLEVVRSAAGVPQVPAPAPVQ